MTYGDWTEQRVTRATALGGQPDFTFAAHVVSRGAGQREIGDTVVWLGSKVLVISSKSRDPIAGRSDSDDDAVRWLDKNIKKACGQVDGVVRLLAAASPGDIELTSERGVVVPWDPSGVETYLGLVVINYSPPSGYVPSVQTKTPTLIIQAREWELLLGEIRSTSGTFEYLEQRLELPIAQPLGTEKEVLGLLGMAEYGEEFVLVGPGEMVVPLGTFDEFRRRFPESELGYDPDDRFGFVIDAMIEQAHDMDPDLTDIGRIHDYLRVVERLDSIARRTRTQIGKKIVEKAKLAQEQGRPRHLVAGLAHGMSRFLFLADPRPRSERRVHLQLLTELLHAKFLALTASPQDAVTLGVATEPYPTAGRSHDYLLCEGVLWEENATFERTRDDLYEQYFSADPI